MKIQSCCQKPDIQLLGNLLFFPKIFMAQCLNCDSYFRKDDKTNDAYYMLRKEKFDEAQSNPTR